MLSGSLFVRLDVRVKQSLGRIFRCIQIHHQTVGLDWFDQTINIFKRYVIVRDTWPRGIPTVNDQSCYFTIVGQQFAKLLLDHFDMLRSYTLGTQPGMRIEDRIIEHHFHPFGTECVGIFFYHVTFERAAHYTIIGRFSIPYTETAMMFRCQTSVGHVGWFCRFCPLFAVHPDRVEKLGSSIRVRPVLIKEGRHVEMNEHTTA